MQEPAASADEGDGERERPLAGAEVEADRDRLAQERHLDVGAERHVRQVENADRDVREREREAGGEAFRRDVEERWVGEPVERDQLAQSVDEAEEPEELDVLQDDVDLGLPRGSAVEREVVEPEPDELRARQQVESEVLELGEDVDPHLVLRRTPLDGQHEAVLLELEHCTFRWYLAERAPGLENGHPLEAELRLDAAGRQAVDEAEDVLDQVCGIRKLAQDPGQGEQLLADQRRQLRSDLLHVGGRVPQRLQRVGESGRDLRLGLPGQACERSSGRRRPRS